MGYRIIERQDYKGRWNFVCEEHNGRLWTEAKIYKKNPSWWDVWAGTHVMIAAFDTLEEAKAFIEAKKELEPKVHYV